MKNKKVPRDARLTVVMYRTSSQRLSLFPRSSYQLYDVGEEPVEFVG